MERKVENRREAGGSSNTSSDALSHRFKSILVYANYIPVPSSFCLLVSCLYDNLFSTHSTLSNILTMLLRL